jgi:hypothetical protein
MEWDLLQLSSITQRNGDETEKRWDIQYHSDTCNLLAIRFQYTSFGPKRAVISSSE